MTKVYLFFGDDGHGAETPGKRTPYLKSLGRQIKENEFNKPVVNMLCEELKRAGVHVYQVAPGDDDTPLKQRTDYANKIYWQYCSKYGKENVVAVYVSIHYNAFDAVFNAHDPSGFSVHINPGSTTGRRLAECIIGELKNGTKQVNRGVVEQNLYVTRTTVMPAVLSENGFMDNQEEALLMLNTAFQKEVAVEHAKGICKYFGIPYVEEKPVKEVAGVTYIDTQPPQNWRLQTGAFGDVETAEEMHSKFDDAFPELAKYSRVEGLRIVTGTWPSAATAEEYKKKVKQKFDGWWIYIKEA